MNKPFFLLPLLSLLLVTHHLTAAAEFTAEEAVARALDNHPALRGAQLAVEEEKGAALQAGLPPNPEVEIGVESWSVSGNRENSMEFLAGVSQPLPLSGARRTARRAGLAGAEAAEFEATSLRREITAEVERLFYETLVAQQRAEIAGELCTREGTLVELTRKRFELGDLPEVDYMRAAAEHARYQTTLEETIRDLNALRARLAHLCGMEADVLPECAGTVSPTPDTLPEETVLEDSLLNSPRHQARLLRETQASGEADAVRRSAVPEPSLRVGLRRDTREGSNAVDVGLSVGLPLFDRNQGALSAARARTQRIRAENEAAHREEVRQAIALLHETRRALATADHLSGQVLPKQEASREALEQALHLGGTTLFEVLAEYRGISETKRAILESEAQARFALIELKALL